MIFKKKPVISENNKCGDLHITPSFWRAAGTEGWQSLYVYYFELVFILLLYCIKVQVYYDLSFFYGSVRRVLLLLIYPRMSKL